MVIDMWVDIPQLVREHLKTLRVSKYIEKILHAGFRELLLMGDNVSILIILKNVS